MEVVEQLQKTFMDATVGPTFDHTVRDVTGNRKYYLYNEGSSEVFCCISQDKLESHGLTLYIKESVFHIRSTSLSNEHISTNIKEGRVEAVSKDIVDSYIGRIYLEG